MVNYVGDQSVNVNATFDKGPERFLVAEEKKTL